MYNKPADQPLFCIQDNVCVSCSTCEYFKNDPGNVQGYSSMADCQVSLQQSLAMANQGGTVPQCACSD